MSIVINVTPTHPHHTSHHTHTHTHTSLNVTLDDSKITHLVVANEVEPQHIPPTPSRILVVKQQWFWESIQIEACADEALYQAKVGQLWLINN